MQMIRSMLVALLLLIFSVGCTSDRNVDPAEAKVGVQLAVGGFLLDSPEKCPRAVAVFSSIESNLSETPIVRIENTIKEFDGNVNWSALDEGETILLRSLLGVIGGELQRRRENDVIPDRSYINATSLIAWIKETIHLSCSQLDTSSLSSVIK